jgi:hypothetical protein
MENVRYPFGKASNKTLVAVATNPFAVENSKTFLDMGVMAQDSTLNLSIPSDLPVGSELIITATSDGTARAFIPGTGMSGVSIAGVISKTKVIKAEFNGVAFVVVSVLQVN